MRYIAIILIGIVMSGCSHRAVSTMQEYMRVLEEAGGLVSQLELEFMTVKATLLPPEYLTLRDLERELITQEEVAEKNDYYAQTVTLMIEFEPISSSEFEKRDLLTMGVRSYQEYKQRVEEMSFNLKENIFLQSDQREVKCVLENLENTYGVTSGRKAHMVFPVAFNDIDARASLKFYDQIFQSGIHTIPFDIQHEELPVIDMKTFSHETE